MAGITQKSYVAFFFIVLLQRDFKKDFFLSYFLSGRTDANQQEHTKNVELKLC